MLKVAMLSKWHVHAEDYANQLLKSGKVEIVSVWDEIPTRGIEWAEKLGAKFHPSLDTVLSDPEIQAVICDTPTTMHKEVLIAAAKAGKDIFTEKMLATTLAEAKDIAKAVKEANVNFVISYPLRRNALFQWAKNLADSGEFGKIGMIRMSRSHSGISDNWLVDYWFDVSKTGGGAMMDLGAHPMYILSWFGGEPKRISAIFNKLYNTTSDENALATIEFKNGIIGIGETSFVSYNTPDILEIYGTDATLYIFGDQVKLTSKKKQGPDQGYFTPEIDRSEPKSAIECFIDACLGTAPVPEEINIDSAVAVCELMELAYKSNEQNIIVEV